LQVLYSVRSERLLMEELQYNLLFRWFVGLNMDDAVWTATTFSKNRERLLTGEIAAAFFDAIRRQARGAGLLSDEHFTVDGTLLEAWAGQKSLMLLEASAPPDSTVGGDKNFDVRSFVAGVRDLAITPHVEQKLAHSAIDGRTTRHESYAISQRKRKLVEQAFGWMKTIGLLRKLRHRGGELVDWVITFTATAFNLTRMRTLRATCLA
jgi:IS5 family transposase